MSVFNSKLFALVVGMATLTSQLPFTNGGRLGTIHIDTKEGR